MKCKYFNWWLITPVVDTPFCNRNYRYYHHCHCIVHVVYIRNKVTHSMLVCTQVVPMVTTRPLSHLFLAAVGERHVADRDVGVQRVDGRRLHAERTKGPRDALVRVVAGTTLKQTQSPSSNTCLRTVFPPPDSSTLQSVYARHFTLPLKAK